MLRTPRALAVVLSFGVAACQDTGPTNPLPSADFAASPAVSAATAAGLGASGGGHYDIGGLIVQFGFTATQGPGGQTSGQFHITADEGGGLTIDVSGEVICMTVDPVNHRAWIGALVTKNRSTDPDLLTQDHEVGDDVWFRVLDSGEGDGAVDRTTFTGFKGAAGFDTSPQYCAGQPWPDGNARTWPVTGNISVRP